MTSALVRRSGRVALSLVVVLALASPAEAQEGARALAIPYAPRASELSLDLGVMTLLPLVVGGTVALEVPGHVVVRFGAGIVPSSYVDAINAAGIDVGAYSAQSAQVASNVLDDATFLELGLGIRPGLGLEIDVSWAMLWSQRSLETTQLGAAVGRAGMDLTVDAIHTELAWQSEPAEHLFFRIAIGWAHAFDHHVSLAGAPDAATRATLEAAASALSDTVARYAFGPTLGASLGARL